MQGVAVESDNVLELKDQRFVNVNFIVQSWSMIGACYSINAVV